MSEQDESQRRLDAIVSARTKIITGLNLITSGIEELRAESLRFAQTLSPANLLATASSVAASISGAVSTDSSGTDIPKTQRH